MTLTSVSHFTARDPDEAHRAATPLELTVPDAGLLCLAAMSAVVALSPWGLYFTGQGHLASEELRHAMIRGYGHFALFAAGAATGAGMLVMLHALEPSAHVASQAGVLATVIPVWICLLTLWLIRDRFCLSGVSQFLLPAVAVLVLLVALSVPVALEIVALVLIVTVLIRRRLTHQATEGRI